MNSKSQKLWPCIWLVFGTVLMYFSNWNWAIPAASWLYAVFLLRYTRTRKALPGLLVLCSVSMLVGAASMWRLLGLAAIPPWFRLASGIAVGLVFAVPFVLDRLLVARLPGIAATLIFPCAWTACEYLKSLGGGSWGSLAYTQYGNLPLMQLASVTGIWGLSFVVAWFASVVTYAWEQGFHWQRIRKITIAYGFILVCVFAYGFVRLGSPPVPADKVRIASITNPRDFFTRFYLPDWSDRNTAYASMKEDLAFLLDASGRSVQAGAQVVIWQEYSMTVMEEHEKEFLARTTGFAKDNNIYLAMAIAVFPLSYPELPWQNKLLWIAPDGKIIAEYLKSKPAQPLEPIVPGKVAIPILDTPYGKIASVICADLDYPSLLHQGRVYDADILVIPAQDWASADPLHTRMSVFRAIENGVSVVKSTGGGLSIAVDPYGRIITVADFFTTDHNAMISSLATKGVGTVYSSLGDAFAWLCVLGILLLCLWGVISGKSGASASERFSA